MRSAKREVASKVKAISEGVLRSWKNLHEAVEFNLSNYPYLADYAMDVKNSKLEIAKNYDYWVDRAVEKLRNSSVHAYFAKSGESARKIVGDIIGSGKIVVKAKSMVSEEIGLREHLIDGGNEVWETDLGELIIQLAGDKPMHMIIPAIHYSEKQVRTILAKIGIRGSNAEELAEEVRKFMRDKFLRADVGISGCNAFSIESGRIFLVENEGNIRLSTTLPKKYIALVSIDKLLHDDTLALKSILVQSAYFGTFPPAYININEKVEEQELHVIFIDNGRSSARFVEQLSCVKCGRCQLECPVFQVMGNLWGGTVYGGPMGIGWNEIVGEHQDIFISCLCGKCKYVCPVGIDIPEIIRRLRVEEFRKRWRG